MHHTRRDSLSAFGAPDVFRSLRKPVGRPAYDRSRDIAAIHNSRGSQLIGPKRITLCGTRRMAEGAAHLVDEGIPQVPVRQWVLSLPIPLRILFAAHPELLTPVPRIIHCVIAGFLRKQAGLKRATADTGAVTLIQRFGSAANLNIHLHCLVLDGVYRRTGGEPDFQAVRRRVEDHRRHRGAGGDCQDPHASGLAGARVATCTRAAAASLRDGLIGKTRAVVQQG